MSTGSGLRRACSVGGSTLAAAALVWAASAGVPAAASGQAEDAGWSIAYEPAGPDTRASIVLTGTHRAERVAVRQELDGQAIVFRSAAVADEPRAPFVNVTGCDQLSDHEVSCPDVADETHSGHLLLLPDGLQGPPPDEPGAGDVVTWDVQDARAGVHVFGGVGDDILRGSSPGLARAYGGDGDDYAAVRRVGADQATGLRDRVFGGDGNDELHGSNALGGRGDDVLFLVSDDPEAAHVLRGQAGDDTLTGSELDDTLRAGRGRDRVLAGAGRDVLYGGRGADALFARDGTDDDINCGRGRDGVRSDWRDLLHRCELRIR